MKSIKLKHNMLFLWLLISITVFSGCAAKMVFDHRDYVELPKGTVIKAVPFYVQGEGKDPVTLEYVTPSEGAWYSQDAQKVLV